MWPTWLLSPREFVRLTVQHPYRALFYLSVGGWMGLVLHNLTH